jgi:hypothetical protein
VPVLVSRKRVRAQRPKFQPVEKPDEKFLGVTIKTALEMAAGSIQYARGMAEYSDGDQKKEGWKIIESYFDRLVGAYHVFEQAIPESTKLKIKMGAKWTRDGFVIIVCIPTEGGGNIMLEEVLGVFPSDALLLQVRLVEGVVV